MEIARDDPRPETETARRFNEEDREIPAGSPAAIQSVDRRLGAFILPALIADPSRDAGAQVLEQGKRVRRIATDKGPRPIPQPPCRVRVLLDRQSAKIDPIIVGISEGVENGGNGDVKDGPGGGVVLEFVTLSITRLSARV